MYSLISGLLIMGYAVVGLFFFKHWRTTQDRLFAWFSTAFLVLAAQRFALIVTTGGRPGNEEHHAEFYVLRLIAFLLILGAIIDKNRAPGRL